MAPSTCKDQGLLDITNCPQLPPRPKSLCGTWMYEYKSPYCPYGNQHLQSTYMLLSCGSAYQSQVEKYDEGSDYFSEERTSGWGEWCVKRNGELIITCRTVTTVSVGGSVCGDECQWRDNHYSAENKLHESLENFLTKYTRHGSFDEIEEEKLRAQMRIELKSLPPQGMQNKIEQDSLSPSLTAPAQLRRGPRSSSPTCQQQSALSGLHRMFSGSKRRCS